MAALGLCQANFFDRGREGKSALKTEIERPPAPRAPLRPGESVPMSQVPDFVYAPGPAKKK
jgi:hypothetical protein